jgi:hypothetical protein
MIPIIETEMAKNYRKSTRRNSRKSCRKATRKANRKTSRKNMRGGSQNTMDAAMSYKSPFVTNMVRY